MNRAEARAAFGLVPLPAQGESPQAFAVAFDNDLEGSAVSG
jgi:hypothetical protein